MTNKFDDGGPAYPVVSACTHEYVGMSLRDHFAGQALVGSMVNATGLGTLTKSERQDVMRQVAELLYEVADAMIEARNQ